MTETIDKHAVGMYEKFRVERTDGSSAEGGKHEHCQYFVLDIDHDPHALAALKAYEQSCAAEYPALARDLRDLRHARMIRDVEGLFPGDPRGEPR